MGNKVLLEPPEVTVFQEKQEQLVLLVFKVAMDRVVQLVHRVQLEKMELLEELGMQVRWVPPVCMGQQVKQDKLAQMVQLVPLAQLVPKDSLAQQALTVPLVHPAKQEVMDLMVRQVLQVLPEQEVLKERQEK